MNKPESLRGNKTIRFLRKPTSRLVRLIIFYSLKNSLKHLGPDFLTACTIANPLFALLSGFTTKKNPEKQKLGLKMTGLFLRLTSLDMHL